jgi:hypothetical protein
VGHHQRAKNNDKDSSLCDHIGMAKKTKKKNGKSKEKSTDWALGQPLVFPKKKKPATGSTAPSQ